MPSTALPKSTVSKKDILIVEDDQFLLKAYQLKFEKEGIATRTAVNGDDAITMIETTPPPAVVLLDLMLPGKNGFEVLGKIRSTESWKTVPVIVVSNLGQLSDIEQGKKLGVSEYIIKAETRIADIVKSIKKYL